MNARLLTTITAVLLGTAGLALTFLPLEILEWTGAGEVGAAAEPVLQVAGGLYVGFALLDWMVRRSVLGGIYGRPVVMANLVHFTVGGLALLRAYAVSPWILGAGILYVLLAAGFGAVMVGGPST